MSKPVPSITAAQEPLAVDQARRTRSYLIQMSIRVVCFVGAVVVDGWLRWVLVAAAVVLPYSAVLLANAGREKTAHDTSPVTPQAAPALTELSEPSAPREPGRSAASDDTAHDADAPAAPTGPTAHTSPAASGAHRVIDHVDD